MKKKPIRQAALLLAAGFLLFLFAPAAQAEPPAEAPAQVLFLSSYSLAFPTVKRQITGIEAAMANQNVVLSYAFMDTKELDSAEDIDHFADYLAYKWQHVGKPDLVIAGDDSALQLAIDRRGDLFAGIPVIFESIDDMQRALQAHQLGMTGIMESGPMRDNLDLAQKIYPEATRVLAVVDNSPSGRGAAVSFLALQQEYPNLKLELLNTSRLSDEEIRTTLKELDNHTILFYYIFSEDHAGQKYTTAQSADLVFSNSAVPVFYYQIGVGTGSLGGVQVDFEEMGRMASEMSLEVLAGADCAQMPIVYDTPTSICFDAAVMKAYHIPKSVLPKGAVYIHDDTDAQMRTAITLLGIGAAVLFVLLAVVALDNYRRNKREAQLLKKQTLLQQQAEHDALTNLCNRRRFCNILGGRIDQKLPTALLSFDIDHFKAINDTYGHQAGDAVLAELGRRLKAMLDSNISVFRCGGDEFSAVVKSADLQLTAFYAQKLCKVFEEPFPLGDGQQLSVGASLGFARYPQDGKDSQSLIACADAALYSVKRNNRGTVQNYAELI